MMHVSHAIRTSPRPFLLCCVVRSTLVGLRHREWRFETLDADRAGGVSVWEFGMPRADESAMVCCLLRERGSGVRARPG